MRKQYPVIRWLTNVYERSLYDLSPAFHTNDSVADDSIKLNSNLAVARLYSSTDQTITSGGTLNVDYATVDYFNRAFGSFTTNPFVFTAGVSGVYRVTASLLLDTLAWDAGSIAYLTVQRNGVNHAFLHRDMELSGAVTGYRHLHGSTAVPLLAGETVRLQCGQTDASSAHTYHGADYYLYNYVEITYEGETPNRA